MGKPTPTIKTKSNKVSAAAIETEAKKKDTELSKSAEKDAGKKEPKTFSTRVTYNRKLATYASLLNKNQSTLIEEGMLLVFEKYKKEITEKLGDIT